MSFLGEPLLSQVGRRTEGGETMQILYKYTLFRGLNGIHCGSLTGEVMAITPRGTRRTEAELPRSVRDGQAGRPRLRPSPDGRMARWETGRGFLCALRSGICCG